MNYKATLLLLLMIIPSFYSKSIGFSDNLKILFIVVINPAKPKIICYNFSNH